MISPTLGQLQNMRKIDKTCNLSTAYKSWEEEFENKNLHHDEYNSSKGKYYRDIVMQLYHCQNGICAYTEQILCKKEYYSENNWEDGRFNSNIDSKPKGSLEHFDPSKKSTKGWLWDNFFMIDAEVNSVKFKGNKSVDYILKLMKKIMILFNYWNIIYPRTNSGQIKIWMPTLQKEFNI